MFVCVLILLKCVIVVGICNFYFSSIWYGFIIIGVVVYLLICSYSWVIEFFIEFINFLCKFYVYKCLSIIDFDEGCCMGCLDGGCVMMGYDVDVILFCGIFYFSILIYVLFCGIY